MLEARDVCSVKSAGRPTDTEGETSCFESGPGKMDVPLDVGMPLALVSRTLFGRDRRNLSLVLRWRDTGKSVSFLETVVVSGSLPN